MARSKAPALALVLVFSLAACGDGGRPAASAPAILPMEAETSAQLAARLEATLEHPDIVGVCAAVLSGPRGAWTGCAGSADMESTAPLRTADRFRLGSLTKTAVAARVLLLADAGRIDLDEPASTYVGDLPGLRDASVRELLEHRSGMPDYMRSPFMLAELRSTPDRLWLPAELLQVAAMEPPAFEPGAGVLYSNTGYVVLGLAIEAVTGRALGEDLASSLFEPLGLSSLHLAAGAGAEGADEAMVTGHHFSVGPNFTPVPLPVRPQSYVAWDSAMWAAGALAGTASDLASWVRALWGGDPRLPGLAGATVSSGCGGTGTPWQCPLGAGCSHDGHTLGFCAFAAYVPAEDVAIAVVVNTESPRTALIALDLLRIVAPDAE